jgi:hypothetical protein
MPNKAKFKELDSFPAENFLHYVETPSTRSETTIKECYLSGCKIETTRFFRANKELGYQIRDRSGYHYFIRTN